MTIEQRDRLSAQFPEKIFNPKDFPIEKLNEYLPDWTTTIAEPGRRVLLHLSFGETDNIAIDLRNLISPDRSLTVQVNNTEGRLLYATFQLENWKEVRIGNDGTEGAISFLKDKGKPTGRKIMIHNSGVSAFLGEKDQNAHLIFFPTRKPTDQS